MASAERLYRPSKPFGNLVPTSRRICAFLARAVNVRRRTENVRLRAETHIICPASELPPCQTSRATHTTGTTQSQSHTAREPLSQSRRQAEAEPHNRTRSPTTNTTQPKRHNQSHTTSRGGSAFPYYPHNLHVYPDHVQAHLGHLSRRAGQSFKRPVRTDSSSVGRHEEDGHRVRSVGWRFYSYIDWLENDGLSEGRLSGVPRARIVRPSVAFLQKRRKAFLSHLQRVTQSRRKNH